MSDQQNPLPERRQIPQDLQNKINAVNNRLPFAACAAFIIGSASVVLLFSGYNFLAGYALIVSLALFAYLFAATNMLNVSCIADAFDELVRIAQINDERLKKEQEIQSQRGGFNFSYSNDIH